MATLSAKKIQEALKKAQNVGQVEEPVTIVGCEIVLRSLRPDEYALIHQETQELEDISYLIAFKREHLARSIVEVNDADLRHVDFVEVDVEEDDPKTGKPVVKTLKLEKHVFIRDYVIGSWSREAIDVAFRKFNDVVATSEKKASEGISFVVPDETAEEKYRRLLSEAKEVQGHIPVELATKIREDLGYITQPTQVELDAANEKLSKLAEELPTEEAAPAPTPPPAQVRVRPPQPTPPQRPPPIVQPKPLPQDEDQPTAEEIMRARQPLNLQAEGVQVPAPTPSPAMQANPLIPISPAAIKKAAQIAALENMGEEFDPNPPPALQGGSQITAAYPGMERNTPMELTRPVQKVDPFKAEAIFEQPPVAGINARFRKPPQF